MIKIRSLVATVVPFGLAVLTGTLFGAPIVYSYEGVGSGALGGRSFTNATFAFVAQADTANIMPWWGSPLQNTHSSATIAIAGIGVFSVLTPSHTWITQNFGGGLGANLGMNWVTLDEPGFVSAGYGLASSLGPVVDNSPQHVVQFFGVSTSGGSLSFSSIQSITFTATAEDTGAVPEPTAAALLLVGLATLAATRRALFANR